MNTVPLWLLLVLLTLATYRVTRLSTRDELPLVKVPRDGICNWLDPRDEHGEKTGAAPLGSLGRSIAYGIECGWCSSVWWAALLTAVVDVVAGVPLPWLVGAAAAAGGALVNAGELRLEQRGRHTQLQITELRAELRRRGVPETAM